MNKHFNIVSKCHTYTYFLVKGKTSATAVYLGLFIAGRYSHVEPPIVKHSTELRYLSFLPPITTMVFPVITAQHLSRLSNMDGKVVTLPVLQSYMKTSFRTLPSLSRPPTQLLDLSSKLLPFVSKDVVMVASSYIHSSLEGSHPVSSPPKTVTLSSKISAQ